MAERAADRAAVASLPVSHLQQRLVHDRPARARRIGKFKIALTGHGADFQPALGLTNVGEAFDAIEVDDVVGQHEAHVQHGHQRLTTRQQLGVLQRAEESDRLGDGFWIVITEWRRLHR